jgi:hypothetical protein
LVRDQEAAGSNPVAPKKIKNKERKIIIHMDKKK